MEAKQFRHFFHRQIKLIKLLVFYILFLVIQIIRLDQAGYLPKVVKPIEALRYPR